MLPVHDSARITAALVYSCMLMLTACQSCQDTCFLGQPVTVPAVDATPPSAALDAHIPNKPIITVNAASNPQSTAIKGNETVPIFARGDDPEGVKDIQIWLTESWTYTDPNTGVQTTRGPGLAGAPEQSNPDSTPVGGTGCSARLATLNLDFKQRRQGATTYKVTLWAEAVNCSGTTSKTPELTLTWP